MRTKRWQDNDRILDWFVCTAPGRAASAGDKRGFARRTSRGPRPQLPAVPRDRQHRSCRPQFRSECAPVRARNLRGPRPPARYRRKAASGRLRDRQSPESSSVFFEPRPAFRSAPRAGRRQTRCELARQFPSIASPLVPGPCRRPSTPLPASGREPAGAARDRRQPPCAANPILLRTRHRSPGTRSATTPGIDRDRLAMTVPVGHRKYRAAGVSRQRARLSPYPA